MSKVTRRTVLAGIAPVSASGGAVAAILLKAQDELPDPLIELVEGYRTGLAIYEKHPLFEREHYTDEERRAVIDETWDPGYEALRSWDKPAASFAGAMAALSLAMEECERGDNDVAFNMIAAAVAYFGWEPQPSG